MQKLAAKHNTTVTPADDPELLQRAPSQFGTQESRNIRVVLAKNQAEAEAAKKALSRGQSWATVAKKYSTDPTTKNSGGLLNGVTKAAGGLRARRAAFSAPLNKLLGPVKGQFGYYVFEVTKVTPATHQTLAQATALIRQQLTSQSQQTRADRGRQPRQEGLAQPDHLPQRYAMADCKGYKAPKTGDHRRARATGTAPPRGELERPSPPPSSEALRPPRRDHAPAARRMPVGPRAGRALDRPAHASRSPTSWPTRLSAATTRRCSTSSATSCSRCTSCRCCSRSAAPAISPRWPSEVTEKLIRRHPHVFGDVRPTPRSEVRRNWDQIKRGEPGRERRRIRRGAGESPGAAVRAQGAAPGRLERFRLPRASRGRSSRCATSWPSSRRPRRREEQFHELGDVLFAAVNVARKLAVDPELALRAAADRFKARVTAGERARRIGRP